MRLSSRSQYVSTWGGAGILQSRCTDSISSPHVCNYPSLVEGRRVGAGLNLRHGNINLRYHLTQFLNQPVEVTDSNGGGDQFNKDLDLHDMEPFMRRIDYPLLYGGGTLWSLT